MSQYRSHDELFTLFLERIPVLLREFRSATSEQCTLLIDVLEIFNPDVVAFVVTIGVTTTGFIITGPLSHNIGGRSLLSYHFRCMRQFSMTTVHSITNSAVSLIILGS